MSEIKNRKELIRSLNKQRLWVIFWFVLAALLFVMSWLYIMAVKPADATKNSISLVEVPGYLLIFVVIACVVTGFSIRNKYRKSYKEGFVKSALEAVFADVRFICEDGAGIDVRTLEEIGLCNKSVLAANDLITGTYKGVRFFQSDVDMQRRTIWTLSKSPEYKTFFKGRWIILDTGDFPYQIRIAGRVLRNKAILHWVKDKTYKEVLSGNQVLDKSFKVFVPAEQNTGEIPLSLERKFLEISERFNNRVVFVLHQKQIHIGINNNRDGFEPPTLTAINEKYIEKVNREDIGIITGIVDSMIG